MAVREFTSWARGFLTHGTVKGILEMVLMLGVLYFAFSGILVLAFNTDSYWMGVISNSMKHEEGLNWKIYFEDDDIRSYMLSRYGLTSMVGEDHIYDTSRFPISGGFSRGDLLVIKGINSVSDISVGDVLIIKRTNDIPLTHRVFAVWEEDGKIRFTTKGDYNTYLINDDRIIYPEKIVGKVAFVIPALGNISLWFQGR